MRLVIDSRLPEIERATDFAEEFCGRHGLAAAECHALCVVLDELLKIAIRHGVAGAHGHPIAISLDHEQGEITLEIEDRGVAFDPTRAPAPALAGTLAERKAGGLGIAFVRGLTDSMEYRRDGGRNYLTLRRRVAA
jgi:anti-sigma regulatory factor (Ser/Thr protein kinase)